MAKVGVEVAVIEAMVVARTKGMMQWSMEPIKCESVLQKAKKKGAETVTLGKMGEKQ